MAASAIFILDHRGKILISRNYRGDVPMSVASRFINKILEEEEMNIKPVTEEDGVTYIFVKHQNLYLLATTDRNGNAAVTLLFLYKIVQVFIDYFKELEEESIKDNFVVIYELLDEMMDFGYPQTTEPKVLQEYITQGSYKLEKGTPTIPIAATGGVSWRTENIKYRRNEVYLDVIESVNFLVSASGTVLRAEIIGSVKVNSKLSGMPELRLGLNDKVQFDTSSGEGKKENPSKSVELEDVKFHQCVRLTRFEVDRVITFVPPDGEFVLMSYRLNTTVKPLFWIDTSVTNHSKNRVEFLIKAKSQYKPQSIANNVQILVPVPADASSPTFTCSMGSCKYMPEKDAVAWNIKHFPGLKEPTMRVQYTLPSVRNEDGPDKHPPVTVKFEIPYYTVSGIQVRYLKIIEKSGYASLPWVRYLCTSGDYQFRT